MPLNFINGHILPRMDDDKICTDLNNLLLFVCSARDASLIQCNSFLIFLIMCCRRRGCGTEWSAADRLFADKLLIKIYVTENIHHCKIAATPKETSSETVTNIGQGLNVPQFDPKTTIAETIKQPRRLIFNTLYS